MDDIKKYTGATAKHGAILGLNYLSLGLFGAGAAAHAEVKQEKINEAVNARLSALEEKEGDRLSKFGAEIRAVAERNEISQGEMLDWLAEPGSFAILLDGCSLALRVSDDNLRAVLAGVLVGRLSSPESTMKSHLLERAVESMKYLDRDCIRSLMFLYLYREKEKVGLASDSVVQGVAIKVLESLKWSQLQREHLASIGCAVPPSVKAHNENPSKWAASSLPGLKLTATAEGRLKAALTAEGGLITSSLTATGKVIAAQAFFEEFPEAGISLEQVFEAAGEVEKTQD